MDRNINSRCRLCAMVKSPDKLITHEDEDLLYQEIATKLKRLNIVVDFSAIDLPKQVCFVCVDSLNRAYEFLMSLEKAQETFRFVHDSVPNIKQERESENDSTYEQEQLEQDVKTEDSVGVKIEDLGDIESTFEPVCLETRSQSDRKTKKKKVAVKDQALDIIPLSQLKLTWRDYSWVCAFCETQFPSIGELIGHSIQYHNCCNPYRCTDCNLRKLCLKNFLIHIRRHRKYLKLSCYKCFAKFQSPYTMRLHLNKHKTSEFTCPGCNGSFMDHDELENHRKEFYKDKRTREIPVPELLNDNLTCLVCDKTFLNKTRLHTHLLIHTERKRNHICEICGKCFLHKQNLVGHKAIHDDIRPHKCEICKRCFKTAPQLRSHVGTHDGLKPFACEQCGRCFRLQRQLQSHSIVHTDSLPYLCTYCNKSFRFKTILNQHLRQHTGVKPYKCEVCDRDFTNWPNYNKHMKRRHGMDMAKKKHTPDGLYPIDSKTGEVVYPEMSNLEEWKKKMLKNKRPGRPKKSKKSDTDLIDTQ